MKRTFIKITLGALVFGLASRQIMADGPGMVVHFVSLKRNVSTELKAAHLPSGAKFPHAGSIGPNKRWRSDGKTMAAAPDSRELPEWVEFEWQEWPYPFPDMPREPEAYKIWSTEVNALAKSLPQYKQRVLIRDRVPAEVVEELLRSKRVARHGELPDKWLWIHFVWTDEGIKLHWALEWRSPPRGVERVLSSGGDVIDKP